MATTLAPSALINPHRGWFGTGDYDANVLIFAIEQLGYEVKWHDPRVGRRFTLPHLNHQTKP